jgi:hypothetical protein
MAQLGESDEQDVWLRIERLAIELARTVDDLRVEIGRQRGEDRSHGAGERD